MRYFRYYIVNAHQSQKHEKVVEFFERFGRDILGGGNRETWREWFCFPYIKNPELNPVFGPYFQLVLIGITLLQLYYSFVSLYLNSKFLLKSFSNKHQFNFRLIIFQTIQIR